MARLFQAIFAAWLLAFSGGVATPSLGSENAGDDKDYAGPAHGIVASFHPEQARPGDVVEFRVEMIRDEWGQFELHVPSHSELHSIAVEKVPVEIDGDRYRQRESLLFQPVASGTMIVGDAFVSLTTTSGVEEMQLPELRLEVLPFEKAGLSSTPEPFPLDEEGETRSTQFAGTVAAVLGVVAVALFFWLIRQNHRSIAVVESMPDESSPEEQIERLRSGEMTQCELESLLHDSNFELSSQTRSAIERSLYAKNRAAADLAAMIEAEVRT
ncbi:hypothetical protein [Rhodopirellula sallentina]|uniref:Secreted protein n=1 Tax=Rhodopirellula sallentina SM41 TaxID=1263870 RepID=M5UCB2_9BACT|nr:hypothetical protein [Rhodopirellula sallentina]EMI55496.1 secreted protein [Rhodopirellula sallentina SM41]